MRYLLGDDTGNSTRADRSRHRVGAWVASLVALASMTGLAACGGGGSGAAATSTSTTTKSATKGPTLPAAQVATPETSVTNYLAALSRHDLPLAKKFLDSKTRKGIVVSRFGGLSNVGEIGAVQILSSELGQNFRPTVDGYDFPKDRRFASVKVQYRASGTQTHASGALQTKTFTLGESGKSKWLILVIQPS
jgi:hypothetical protein